MLPTVRTYRRPRREVVVFLPCLLSTATCILSPPTSPLLPASPTHPNKIDEATLDIHLNQLHPHSIANINRSYPRTTFPSTGGSSTRTQVPLSEAPVTIPSNRRPMLASNKRAAADLRTWRSILLASSSCSVRAWQVRVTRQCCKDRGDQQSQLSAIVA